jgi:hypothetical protein
MGHDIKIGCSATAYISFNWSCFKDIFHIDQIHGHNNRNGRISRRLREALAVLKERGYTPRNDMRVDGWGQWKSDAKIDLVSGKTRLRFIDGITTDDKVFYTAVFDSDAEDEKTAYVIPTTWDHNDEIMASAPRILCRKKQFQVAPDFTSPDCHCMFAYILQYFLKLAEEYPHETWLSDQVFSVQPLDDDDDDSSEPDREDDKPIVDGPLRFIPDGLYGMRQGNGFIIPVRDALLTEVTSYDQAMTLHLKCLKDGDKVRAQAWFEVAIQFKDAPEMFTGLFHQMLEIRGLQ